MDNVWLDGLTDDSGELGLREGKEKGGGETESRARQESPCGPAQPGKRRAKSTGLECFMAVPPWRGLFYGTTAASVNFHLAKTCELWGATWNMNFRGRGGRGRKGGKKRKGSWYSLPARFWVRMFLSMQHPHTQTFPPHGTASLKAMLFYLAP